jgi:hypothetical protein
MSTHLRKRAEGEAPVVAAAELAPQRERTESVLVSPGEVSASEVAPVVAAATVSATPGIVVPVSPVKSEELTDIEQILAANLADLFRSMPAMAQQAFKQKGEQVATRILQLVPKSPVTFARRAFAWIRAWLSIIPSVSSAYAVQEGKIKTDALLAWRSARHS